MYSRRPARGTQGRVLLRSCLTYTFFRQIAPPNGLSTRSRQCDFNAPKQTLGGIARSGPICHEQ